MLWFNWQQTVWFHIFSIWWADRDRRLQNAIGRSGSQDRIWADRERIISGIRPRGHWYWSWYLALQCKLWCPTSQETIYPDQNIVLDTVPFKLVQELVVCHLVKCLAEVHDYSINLDPSMLTFMELLRKFEKLGLTGQIIPMLGTENKGWVHLVKREEIWWSWLRIKTSSGGFVVTMHEDACRQEVQSQGILFAQARMHCDNKSR